MKPNIDIVLCFGPNYANYSLVTIKSILETQKNNHTRIHILSKGFPKSYLDILKEISDGYDAAIFTYDVDDQWLQNLVCHHFTIFTWYRLLIPQYLPLNTHKALYLDVDVVVLDDLSELFNLDMSNKSVAAVIDDVMFPQKENNLRVKMKESASYFCSGVMLMNLDYWRTKKIAQQIRDWGLENPDIIKYCDQDCTNHVCQDSSLILPLKFGFASLFNVIEYYKKQMPVELKEALLHPVIAHINRIGPWFHECRHPHVFFWHKYNRMLKNHKVKIQYRNKLNFFSKLRADFWYCRHRNLYKNIYTDAISLYE